MKNILRYALSLLVGGLFVWAGGSKVLAPEEMHQSILNYQLVPGLLAWLLALLLPWLELAAGLALVAPWTRRGAILLLGLLLIIFQGGLASAWIRGLDIECGCFGGTSTTVTFAFIRNGILLALLGVIAWMEFRQIKAESPCE